MAGGASHVVRDSRADPDYAGLRAAASVGAYAGYVISDGRGETFGVLCGVRPEPLQDHERIDEALIGLFSSLLSSQLELARRIDRERRRIELADALAPTDALTGLLNRRGWDQILVDAQERIDAFGDAMAVAVIDLNGLKQVNDTQGHAAGDALIRRAAQALDGVCGETSRVARCGGDEFMVLANGVVPSAAPAYFQRFLRALEDAGVSAALGCAAAAPGEVSLVDCVVQADAQMYRHKRAAGQRRVS